ncbi:hypothetical protein BH23DEI1_BH23DEI1_09300 [soil metagenome]
MTDGARRAYLGLARLFLLVGGVVAALGIANGLLALELFQGSPVWTSLFLLGIGGLLHWTATTAERRDDEPAAEVSERESGERDR